MGSAADALPVGQRSPLELIAAVGIYVERLLWPVRLNAYIDHIDTGPITIALAALLLAGIGAALWYWSRVQGVEGSRVDGLGHTDRNPGTLEPANPSVPLFALSWLLLTLIPSLAILWKIPDAPLAERYLYLPSVGFCLLVGHGVAHLWSAGSARSPRVAIAAGMGAVLLTAGIGTVRRNGVWYDDIALWEDTERKSQVSGMAARSLGTAYQQRGRPADARAAFGRALQRVNTSRGRETIYNNLGTLAMYDGDYAAAQRNYESALAANPNGPDTMFNLGLAILHRGGRSREAAQAALVHYQRAQQINPHDSDIEAALAEAYDILGQPAAAGQHARRALDLGAQGQTAETLRALLERM
jgi:tetratricopeptide (TPR) repeat protein